METSHLLFDKEHQSREKYIYFICGVAGALVAYIGKDFKPSFPLSKHDELTLWCLGCLTVSFIFGIGRMLAYIEKLKYNKESVFAEEEISKFNGALIQHTQNPGMVSLTTKVKEPLNKSDIEGILKYLREKVKKENKSMSRFHRLGKLLFVVCHICLIAGFVLLLLSKTLS
jgi:hypothetical protein